MKKISDLASTVANLVYTPTLLAYGWIVVHYVVSGVSLYLIALVVAYKTGAFEKFERWPMISKIVLYAGGPLIGLALYFSTMPTSYLMLIPFGIHVLLSVVAGLSLRSLNAKT
jgi:hypothetical protein